MDDLFGAIIFLIIAIAISFAKKKIKSEQNSKKTEENASPFSMFVEDIRNEILTATQELEAPLKKSSADNSGFAAEGKPYTQHSTDDCTGGSIHDGYHEGTARRPAPASSSEGRLGNQGVQKRMTYAQNPAGGKTRSGSVNKVTATASQQDSFGQRESHSAAYTAAPSDDNSPSSRVAIGADRLIANLSDKPSIVQGVIWSEILGKPKGENY